MSQKRKGSELKGNKPKLRRQNASGSLVKRRKRGVSIGPELKFNDVNFNTDASTTETVVALTTFAAGDTALLRDGNKIICKSLELRILLANEATTQSNTVRFAVVKSLQANSAAPTWFNGGALTDVFDEATVTARRATITASRFKVIAEEVVTINQTNDTSLNQAYIHKFMKLDEDITQYFDGTSAIPVTNAYFLLYLGSSAAGVVDVDVVGRARLRFLG